MRKFFLIAGVAFLALFGAPLMYAIASTPFTMFLALVTAVGITLLTVRNKRAKAARKDAETERERNAYAALLPEVTNAPESVSDAPVDAPVDAVQDTVVMEKQPAA